MALDGGQPLTTFNVFCGTPGLHFRENRLRMRSETSLDEGLERFQTLDWAADGTALFVSITKEGGSTVLRLDLKGKGQLPWASEGTVEPGISAFLGGPTVPWAVPSPDGRHLAICEWNLSANIWLTEKLLETSGIAF